mmetsp:Transcript_46591/g.74915  ORF Transcript_46591/g.74915 Transcript_46591/m.74915 type:complete len:255 (-) Transcript_46591:136-900(-)
MLSRVCRTSRKRIGIMGGSGPDAGVDLMKKILRTNRAFLGPGVGDKDAPFITLMNVPTIGGPHGSWDLQKGTKEYKELIDGMKQAAKNIAICTDYFCIACNTLHKVQPEVEKYLGEEKIPARFISIVDTVSLYCKENNVKDLVVLGSKLTTDVHGDSPYAPLSSIVKLVELPGEVRDMQQQALELIKTKGPENKQVQDLFQTIVDSFDGENVLLGCTEFPLMKPKTSKKLIDPTQLLADRLVHLSWGLSEDAEE